MSNFFVITRSRKIVGIKGKITNKTTYQELEKNSLIDCIINVGEKVELIKIEENWFNSIVGLLYFVDRDITSAFNEAYIEQQIFFKPIVNYNKYWAKLNS